MSLLRGLSRKWISNFHLSIPSSRHVYYLTPSLLSHYKSSSSSLARWSSSTSSASNHSNTNTRTSFVSHPEHDHRNTPISPNTVDIQNNNNNNNHRSDIEKEYITPFEEDFDSSLASQSNYTPPSSSYSSYFNTAAASASATDSVLSQEIWSAIEDDDVTWVESELREGRGEAGEEELPSSWGMKQT